MNLRHLRPEVPLASIGRNISPGDYPDLPLELGTRATGRSAQAGRGARRSQCPEVCEKVRSTERSLRGRQGVAQTEAQVPDREHLEPGSRPTCETGGTLSPKPPHWGNRGTRAAGCFGHPGALDANFSRCTATGSPRGRRFGPTRLRIRLLAAAERPQ